MQLSAITLALLLHVAGRVQAADNAAHAGTPAANVGPNADSQEGVEGIPRSRFGGDLTTQQVCPIEWPRPCPDGVLCCSDAYPWCCADWCCPDAYPYCGNDGRCYAS